MQALAKDEEKDEHENFSEKKIDSPYKIKMPKFAANKTNAGALNQPNMTSKLI